MDIQLWLQVSQPITDSFEIFTVTSLVGLAIILTNEEEDGI